MQALRMTCEEILTESKTLPDGDDLDLNFSKEIGMEEEFESYDHKHPREQLSLIG